MALKLGIAVDLCMAYMLMLISMTLTLMQGYTTVARQPEGKKSAISMLGYKNSVSQDLDYKNMYIWLDQLVLFFNACTVV